MTSAAEITAAVRQLYNTYPFPPEPILDEPPPGYNWRWSWPAAYSFCTGRYPSRLDVAILDAGCGTGVGTEYLAHLNPHAQVMAIDLSEGALEIAQERCRRSRAHNVQFQHRSLYDVAHLGQTFDMINCVGVLHHLPDPARGIQALANVLAPGGILHVFVYGELGRWEIKLMQRAIALLQGSDRSNYPQGVAIGRQIFAALPEGNRLKKREQERWSLDNQRDECFADMYVHPQEIDYTIASLFELIVASGLEFVGFSNPRLWQLERLLGTQPDLLARAQHLSPLEQYQLIEALDPEAMTHYEFFLAKPPLVRQDWSADAQVLAAIPYRHPCLDGWPGGCVFNCHYDVIYLNAAEQQFLAAANGQATVADLLAQQPEVSLEQVRSLLERQLILLAPGGASWPTY